jgi:hypothetical protein
LGVFRVFADVTPSAPAPPFSVLAAPPVIPGLDALFPVPLEPAPPPPPPEDADESPVAPEPPAYTMVPTPPVVEPAAPGPAVLFTVSAGDPVPPFATTEGLLNEVSPPLTAAVVNEVAVWATVTVGFVPGVSVTRLSAY